MDPVLGDNRYGKAETRLLRVSRRGNRHEIRDVSVSVALSGDFDAVHLRGENASVLPTDTQKNTVYAFAREAPVGEIEDFALRLARHFVASGAPVRRARVHVEEYAWSRIDAGGGPHPHAFVRGGPERRTAAATAASDGEAAWVVSGLDGLDVLKSGGSEFHGFARDRYTTLEETHDRILATAVSARWRFDRPAGDWARSFASARRALLETFAGHHSLSLQQTLYEMASAVLHACPELVEVRLRMPNRHHLPVDLAPFGLDNPNEVLFPADRPYGLIEGAVHRRGAAPAPAWLEW